MRRWPLRLKIALWSALVVAMALLVSGVATAQHFYHEDLELVDRQLEQEMRGVFSELARLPPDLDFAARKLGRLLPAAYQRRHVEIQHAGELVYQSRKADFENLAGRARPPGVYSLPGAVRLRLLVAEKGPWKVQVAVETRQERDAVVELLRGSLLALPALLLVTGLGGWWIARQALAPIQAIIQAAGRISAEHLHQRLPVPPGADETRELSQVLNRMIERLECSFHQAQRFSADASHELRTPLAILHAGLEEMLSAREGCGPQEQKLLDLLDASTRLSSLSDKLLLLSRADAGFLKLDRSGFDLAATLREAVEEAAIFAEASHIQLRSEIPPCLELHADADRMMQILRNLLENAVKYNRPNGEVRVELSKSGGSLRLAIANTGAGLNHEQAGKLFTRFYRAEAHRGSPGHGLGLSISREIARAHGGTLDLGARGPDCTEFILTLPLIAQAEVNGAA